MLVNLTAEQARVIGVMLEKEVTTPDQYPLSLNALTTGCNQKSNREPVMSLSEQEVQNVLDELKEKRLISDQSGFGSRVAKYAHRFCNTEFGDLKFTPQQTAILCVLMLRGPQTPGELRTRTNRLAEFNNVDEVESALVSMKAVNGDDTIVKLEREPGKRESRYMHLFSDFDPTQISSAPASANHGTLVSTNDEQQLRIERLEEQVAMLTEKLDMLLDTVNELRN